MADNLINREKQLHAKTADLPAGAAPPTGEISVGRGASAGLKAVFAQIRWYDYLLILPLVLFCFLFFHPEADILVTGNSSLTYLKGHILDFYDYNKANLAGDDYYPLMYVFFAVWNIPLKLLGVAGFSYENHKAMMYEKALPVLMMALSSIPVGLIIRRCGRSIRTAVYGVLLFLTSSVVFTATVCWGMYETTYLFFILFGLYFMIRDEKRYDLALAMLFFGVSFAMKLVGAFLILPIDLKTCPVSQATGC